MRRSTDNLIALQFLAVILPVTLVLLGQLTADARRAEALESSRALREHQQLRIHYRVVLPNGATRHIGSLAEAVIDSADAGPRLVGIDLDITERVAAEHRESALQQQLRDASRHAGMAEVAASVLHNVGNVLNSVNVSASLVSDVAEGVETPSSWNACRTWGAISTKGTISARPCRRPNSPG